MKLIDTQKTTREGRRVYKLPQPIVERLEALNGKRLAQYQIHVANTLWKSGRLPRYPMINGRFIEV